MSSLDALRLAESWVEKKGDDKNAKAILQPAAQAALALAQVMDMSDPKQKTEAVKVVKKAAAVMTDEEAINHAKAFIKQHDK